jgi:hypothetical protein
MKNYISLLGLLMLSLPSVAQFSVSKGKDNFQISLRSCTFYNNRLYLPEALDLKKDRIRLRDMQAEFKARFSNQWKVVLQVDFADLASGSIEDEDNGLMEAHVTYRASGNGPEIQIGFDKVPYSRSSLSSLYSTPFFSRAEVVSGDFFARRDVGVLVTQGLKNDRIMLYGGAYTGMGEASLRGDNDASGTLEYVGRVELSYPSKFRHSDIDDKISQRPMISIGANARYTEKKTDTGIDYFIKTINGSKSVIGFDIAFQYKGLSFLYELHRAHMLPNDTLRLLNSGGNYINAGGYLAQLVYKYRPWHSVWGIRYDEINPNDLILNDINRSVTYSYRYTIPSSNTSLMFNYMIRLPIGDSGIKWKRDDIRIGIQTSF